MNLVSLDLELNQLSPPKIIQIGYVVANSKTGHILHRNKIYVNPNETLLPEIIELTGITQEHVDHALQMKDAYDAMVNDLARFTVTKIGLTWGDGDLRALREQAGLTADEFMFKRNYINVKAMYQAYAMVTGRTMIGGLGKATKELYGGFKGRQHDALDDAENTWYAFREMTKKFVIADKILALAKGE